MSRGLLRSTAVVGAMTLVSRVLGLVRDIVIARVFGAGSGADAFFVAFKIPNFLRRLFAEGSFSQAFVPVLSEYRVRRTVAETRELVAVTSGLLGGILLAVTALGILAAPVLVVATTSPAAYVTRYAAPDKAGRVAAAAGAPRLGDAPEQWPVPFWFVDGGMALMGLLLAATEAGLGACLFGVFEHEAAVREAFGIPAERRLLATVALGHPAPDRPSASSKRAA